MTECFNGVFVLILTNVLLLLVLYTLTLVKVIRGSKYCFLIQFISFMIISNLGSLVATFARIYWCTSLQNENPSSSWNVVYWLSRAVQDGFC